MRLFLFILGFIAIYGCNKESISADDFDRKLSYFPFKQGNSWVYAYDSIIYLTGGSMKDTSSGFLKFQIGDSLVSNEFAWIKSISKSPTTGYEINRLESISLANNRLVTTDNNLKFINLVFPPDLGTEWNGNIFFNDEIEVLIGGDPYLMYKDWNYKVTTIDTTLIVNGKTYADVIRVAQTDKENAIERRLSEEFYAKDVGLILKRIMILNTQNVASQLPWEQKAQSGMIYTQRIINQ
ncbi:MAG TPA: hypothetical protein PLZ32_19730 [Saprospiraceae bacterium]|nr:hypothetical protein [Saprospiraceae bacterium]